MNDAVSKMPAPYDSIVDGLNKMEGALRSALPVHIPVERFVRVCLTAVQMSPRLLQCDRKSLFMASLKCAQDGLLPDGRDAALVPFKDGKASKEMGREVWAVQYIPMVFGILKKVRNSGELKSITSQVVHENDKFFYRLGDDEKIEHEPLLDGDRGKPRLVYAVAHTNDGGIYREVMTVGEIEKVRQVSRAKDSGPWVQWWSEMARKTVIRRLSKRLPMSTDLDDLIRRDDSLYDFEGAKEAAQHATIAKPQHVAGALALFAGEGNGGEQIDHDPETGEIRSAAADTEKPQQEQPAGPQEKPADAPKAEAATEQPAQQKAEPLPSATPVLGDAYVQQSLAFIANQASPSRLKDWWRRERSTGREAAKLTPDQLDQLEDAYRGKLTQLETPA